MSGFGRESLVGASYNWSMSFRSIAREMRQPEMSFTERRTAFRSLLEGYSQFCRQSHQAIYARFADEFGFNDERVSDADERLLRALDALENERIQKLEQLRVFDLQRAKAKMRGRRTLSKAEQAKLKSIRNATKPGQTR